MASMKNPQTAQRIAELMRYQTSKSDNESISFKEYVDRMKEGKTDMNYIMSG